MQEENSKSRFLASTLHEIRTPIQTIIGTLELLGDTVLDKEQYEYVRQIQFSADVLLTLANDVLDFSKLQSGKFNIESIPYNVMEITEHVVDLISIEAHNRGLEIVTDIDYGLPQFVMGDPTRTQQILLNLIKNAVKFTSTGYIRIILNHDKKNNMLLFQVQDSGIGIPEEKQKQIFSDFYQVDASTTRKYGGTGLGLSISQNLVRIMKGKIGMISNPSGGSIFWFALPLILPPEDQLPQNSKISMMPYTQPQERILLVDDNSIALESLRKKLKNLGCTNIETATSGAEALEKLRHGIEINNPFIIAFIDMIMPTMDGWRLSAEINADRKINDTKLYLMVPEGQMGGDAKMKMLDWFNGYLYKPIKRSMLVSLLNESCDQPLDLEVVDPETENIPEQKQPQKVFSETIASNLTCLVAEDHPINQKLMQTFLQQFGATVITAADGQQAVDTIKENPNIDLIFMDIQMPVKNGIEAAKEIRKNGYKGFIIACTANADRDEADTYNDSGMNDVLIKPFKKIQIQEIIAKWLPQINSLAESKSQLTFTNLFDESLEPLQSKQPKDNEVWLYNDMLETLNNDYELAIQLVLQYIEQTKAFIVKAKESLYLYNFQSLGRIAHTIKGSSGAISAFLLAEIASHLEIAAKESQFDSSNTIMNEFIVQFTEFNDIANEILEKWKNQ